jgi:quercetin dioxygenase-like cupin family protein
MSRVMRRDEQRVIDGPADWFTGMVTIRGQFSRDEPSRLGGAVVTFQAGARTAWHAHPLGQTLIVVDGVGWTQVEGEPVEEFTAGDIVLCPHDRPHWHGATPDGPMTHVAIQESAEGRNVTWMHKVSDDEYLARRRA